MSFRVSFLLDWVTKLRNDKCWLELFRNRRPDGFCMLFTVTSNCCSENPAVRRHAFHSRRYAIPIVFVQMKVHALNTQKWSNTLYPLTVIVMALLSRKIVLWTSKCVWKKTFRALIKNTPARFSSRSDSWNWGVFNSSTARYEEILFFWLNRILVKLHVHVKFAHSSVELQCSKIISIFFLFLPNLEIKYLCHDGASCTSWQV